MYSRNDCLRYVGQYVRFQSAYGYHEGIVERVSQNNMIVRSPRKYIPAQLAVSALDEDEVKRLDLALAWGGYGARGYGAGGYGAGGYGGWGGYGWGRWAVSFLVIYALWGLWW